MKNVCDRSSQLVDGLKKIPNLQNLRNAGLLVAFDLKNFKMREELVSKLFKNNMIVNPTKDLTIRLRPPLSVTSSEINQALDIIKNSMDTIE